MKESPSSESHGGGAVATYLCEARSDDSLWVNWLLPEPAPGDELPVLWVARAAGVAHHSTK